MTFKHMFSLNKKKKIYSVGTGGYNSNGLQNRNM